MPGWRYSGFSWDRTPRPAGRARHSLSRATPPGVSLSVSDHGLALVHRGWEGCPIREQIEPTFRIRQSTDPDGFVRLTLIGEFDAAVADVLISPIEELRLAGANVRIDLSKLTFMDLATLRAVIREVNRARGGGWRLEVDRKISRAVKRLVELAAAMNSLWPKNGNPPALFT